MKSILSINAHPDDEAFGSAGTLARYASQGVPVHVLTFTTGQVGIRPEPLETPEQLGVLRLHELLAACRVIGTADARVLDYMDGQLDTIARDELVRHVVNAIEASDAGLIIGPGPLGITRHADHIAVHHAMMEAVTQCGRPLPVFYVAVPPPFADELNVVGPEREPTHEIDITDYFETKLAALACHSSQQDVREFFLRLTEWKPTTELFHRASPATGRGELMIDLFDR